MWQILCNISYIDIVIGILTYVLRNCEYNFKRQLNEVLATVARQHDFIVNSSRGCYFPFVR
jgi:hypothetical protein